MPTDPHQEIKLFYCYAREDNALQETLEIHLSGLKRDHTLTTWSDYEIQPGENWQQAIHSKLRNADIILLLISPNFMASDYCYSIEMEFALEKHRRGNACVIPIILRPTDWKNAPFSQIQALPSQEEPITQWANRDAAFLDVVTGMRKIIEGFISHSEEQNEISEEERSVRSKNLLASKSDINFGGNLKRTYAENATINKASPPNQTKKKTGSILLVWIGSIVGLILAGSIIFYEINSFLWQRSQSTNSSIRESTPTLSGLLDSPDIAIFIAEFNNNIAADNWNAIAAHTDTTNFANQSSYNRSEIKNENWSETSTDLQNGKLVTKVDIPLDFLNRNASLACAMYGSDGVVGHQVNVHQIYYIYAWGVNGPFER